MGQRKKKRLAGELAAFVRQYRRKAHPKWDPNDRGYDRKLEEKIKRMKPEELDAMLRDEVDTDDSTTT